VNGSLTRYLYEYQRVVLEVNIYGDQTGRNVYGINLLTRQVGVDTFLYMYNGHADVTALLSTTGTVVATYYYDAFGNILDQTGVLSNNILYAGYQYDSETGLYYLNARMYDPVTARFMQEDTFTGDRNDPLSLNLYTYCHNEPLMYSDPTGHYAEQEEEEEEEEEVTWPSGMPAADYVKYATQQKNEASKFHKPAWPSGMPSTDYNTVCSVAENKWNNANIAESQEDFKYGKNSGGMPADLYEAYWQSIWIDEANKRIDEIVLSMGKTKSDKALTPNRDLIAEVYAYTSMTAEEDDLFWDSLEWLGTPYPPSDTSYSNQKTDYCDCGGFVRSLYEERGIVISMSGPEGFRESSRMSSATEDTIEQYYNGEIRNEDATNWKSLYNREINAYEAGTLSAGRVVEDSSYQTGDAFFYDLSDASDKPGVDHVGLYLGQDSEGRDIFIETANTTWGLRILGPETEYGVDDNRYDNREQNVTNVKRYL